MISQPKRGIKKKSSYIVLKNNKYVVHYFEESHIIRPKS